MGSSAPHATSLLEKYSGSEYEEGFFLFKNSGTGQNKYHITKKDSSECLCGHYNLDRQHNANTFQPREVELGMSLKQLEDKAGIGKSICKQCLYQWEEKL